MNSAADHRTKTKIDLNKVPPLDHHRTAVTFNCLILKMTEILNNFGNKMEEVLERAEQSLDMADRKLRLMEAKLTIVNVEERRSENIQSTLMLSAVTEIETQKHPVAQIFPSSSNCDAVEVPVEKEEMPVEKEDTTSMILIKDDPAYSKYFKMLKMGVPEAGVIQKMDSEGIDPNILKRGDEPSRPQALKTSGYDSSGESVSSFSDSD